MRCHRMTNEGLVILLLGSVGLVSSFSQSIKDEHVELPQLPFAVPTRPAGFVYKGGKTSAPLHLDVFLDLTCADSRDLWPTVKELAESFGPDRLRVTVHFFALAYFNNAFISLQSVYIVAAYNSSLLFPWVDMVFENRDYLINSKTTKMNRLDIAEIMEELGNKNNIPSDVMRKGLTDWPLERQSRLAWKYACSKGVSSTPTVFMNGVFVAGDVSAKWTEEQWKGLINKMLR